MPKSITKEFYNMGNDLFVTAEPSIHLPIIVDEDFSVEDDTQIDDAPLFLAGAAPALFPKWSPAPFSSWVSLGESATLPAAANNVSGFTAASSTLTVSSVLVYGGLILAAAATGYGIGRGIRYVYDSRYDIADWWREATYEPLDLEYYQKKFEAEDRLRRNDPLHIDTGGKSWEELQEERDRFQRKQDEYIAQWNEIARQTLLRTNGRTWVPSEIPELWALLHVSPASPTDTQFSFPQIVASSRGSSRPSAKVRSSEPGPLDDPETRKETRRLLLWLIDPANKLQRDERQKQLTSLRALAAASGVNYQAIGRAFGELEENRWQFDRCNQWRALSLPEQVDLARRLVEYRPPHFDEGKASLRNQLLERIAQKLESPQPQPITAPHRAHPAVDPQIIEAFSAPLTQQQLSAWNRLREAFPNGGTDPITRIVGNRADDIPYEVYRTALTSLIAVLLNSLEIYLRRNNLDTVQKMKEDPFLRRWFDPYYAPVGVTSGRAVPNLTGSFGRNPQNLLGCIYEFRGQVRMGTSRASFVPTPADTELANLFGEGRRINPDGLYTGVSKLGGRKITYLVEIKASTSMQLAGEPFLDQDTWRSIRVGRNKRQGKATRQFLRTARALKAYPHLGWHLTLITSRGRGMNQEAKVAVTREHLAHTLYLNGFNREDASSIMDRVRVTVLTPAPPTLRSNGQAK